MQQLQKLHLNFWEKRNLKKWERGLFTGGPAPTNRPSQRRRVASMRARRHHDPPPPIDSASALAILLSTPCASSRSLSRSLASAPRAPQRHPPLELHEPPPPCSKCLAASQRLLPPLQAPYSLQRTRTRSSRASEPPQGAKFLVGECAASPELSAVSVSLVLPFPASSCLATVRILVAVTP